MIPAHRLTKEVRVPSDVTIELGEEIKISGPKGEVKRKLRHPLVAFKKEADKLIVLPKGRTKNTKKIINTFNSHIKNMIRGVMEGYVYKLKVCSSHFPMTVTVEGNKVVIKNFFGEKVPRIAEILAGVKVQVKGDEIFVEGIDIEVVSQTAANIESATRRTGYDKRVFNDGIWISEKAGKTV